MIKFKIPSELRNFINSSSHLGGTIFYDFKRMVWCCEILFSPILSDKYATRFERETYKGVAFIETDEEVFDILEWIKPDLIVEAKYQEKCPVHFNLPIDAIIKLLASE